MSKTRNRDKAQIWKTSWSDQASYQLSYGALGDVWYDLEENLLAVREPPKIKPGQFFRARKKWNQFVTQANKHGFFEDKEATYRRSCKIVGVTAEVPTSKYACHDRLCPYCYYRRLNKFLRRISTWKQHAEWDLLTWQWRINETDLVKKEKREQLYEYPCTAARSYLTATCAGYPNLTTSNLWVKNYDSSVRAIFHRCVVLGPKLPVPGRSEMFSGDLEHIHLSYQQALSVLRYCSNWLRVPFHVGRAIADWNSHFRTRVHVPKQIDSFSTYGT